MLFLLLTVLPLTYWNFWFKILVWLYSLKSDSFLFLSQGKYAEVSEHNGEQNFWHSIIKCGTTIKLNPVPRRKLWNWFIETDLLLTHFYLDQVIMGIIVHSTQLRSMNYKDWQVHSFSILFSLDWRKNSVGDYLSSSYYSVKTACFRSSAIRWQNSTENIQMTAWILLLCFCWRQEKWSQRETNKEQKSTDSDISSPYLVMTMMWHLWHTKQATNQKQRYN